MTKPTPTHPDDAALGALFEKTAKVRFARLSFEDAEPASETRLVVEKSDLGSLRAAMRLAKGPGPHCLCMGDMEAFFEDAAGNALTRMTLHHGYTVRWSGPWEWRDAAFADPDGFMEWLAERGVRDYVEQRDEERANAAEADDARDRWIAATPSCLRARIDALEDKSRGLIIDLKDEEVNELLSLLRQDLGSDTEAAWALLSWLGQGEGPWSPAPAYERAPETLLLKLGMDVILRSVEGRAMTEPVRMGLARVCASPELGRTRRSDRQKVPVSMRQTLIAHVRDNNFGDNLQWIEHAFHPPARPTAKDGGTGIVCVHPDRPMSAVAVVLGSVFAVEPFGLVRFDPGREEPVTVFNEDKLYASLLADGESVIVLDHRKGTIARIPHGGGERQILAEGRDQMISPCLSRGLLAFGEVRSVPDPKRGLPYVVRRTAVFCMPREGGPIRELCADLDDAQGLAIAGDRAVWVESVNGKRRIAGVRLEGGPVETLVGELGEASNTFSPVHIAGDGDHFLVSVPTTFKSQKGSEIRRYDQHGTLAGQYGFVPCEVLGALVANDSWIAVLAGDSSSFDVRIGDRKSGWLASTHFQARGVLAIQPALAEDGVYLPMDNTVVRVSV